jgi:hypothetical protein
MAATPKEKVLAILGSRVGYEGGIINKAGHAANFVRWTRYTAFRSPVPAALCTTNRRPYMKRSRMLWVLIVFFTWAALKSAGSLVWHEPVSDYALLSSLGIGWLFFAFYVPNFLLEAATAFFLFKQKSTAYTSGVATAALACLSGTVVTIFSAKNIDAVKSIYIASREARGMSVNQESMGIMFTPTGLFVMLFAYFLFYALIVYCLNRIKKELVIKSA